jgi:PBP1b-binding outer membrane lipoprotein LpoB
VRDRCAPATALLLAVALGGCSQTMRVSSQVDSTANWRAYRRYAWASSEPHVITPPAPPKDFSQLDATIRRAVEMALAVKGYVRDEFDQPDFLVNYQMVFSHQTTETIQDYYWYKRTGGPANLSDAFVMGYDQATLHLELTTPQTGWAIWRAAATAVANPKAQTAQVDEAVRLMFENLPAVGGQGPRN